MASITITYTAPVQDSELAAQICRLFVPNNAAADLPVFAGTYYDTNVDGFGKATALADFIKNSVAHPGLVAALKRAFSEGSYEYETEDENTIMYLEEVAPAVADQGFKIEISKN